MSIRDARYATSLADARYSASVKPIRRYVQPSCSIPIDRAFTRQLPACQAMSDVETSWTIEPFRETTKCDEPCERGFRSQRTEPVKRPSVTWITIRSIVRIGRAAGVRFREASTSTFCAAGAATGRATAASAQSVTRAATTAASFSTDPIYNAPRDDVVSVSGRFRVQIGSLSLAS